MINKRTGEVTVELDGNQYTFALTLSAMASLEDLFKVKFDAFVKEAESGSMKHLQAFMWAALQKHHPDLSIKEAGDLVTVGSLDYLNKTLLDVTGASAPDPDDIREVTAHGKKANPTRARVKANGTGASSTSTLGGLG